jgi:hypothetical protein
MLRSKVEFDENRHEIVITRPAAWLAILAVPQIVLNTYQHDYFDLIIWFFIYGTVWPRFYRERFQVSEKGVWSKKGLWRFSDQKSIPFEDISGVTIAKSKEKSKRGFTAMGTLLTLNVKRRYCRFLGGASADDAEVVSGWIDGFYKLSR